MEAVVQPVCGILPFLVNFAGEFPSFFASLDCKEHVYTGWKLHFVSEYTGWAIYMDAS